MRSKETRPDRRCPVDIAPEVMAGVLCGLIGCAAPGVLFERALKKGKRVSVSLGVVSILASFLMLSLALLAVRVLAAEKVLPFGCAMVAAFLLFWAVEAVRGWMAANGRL